MLLHGSATRCPALQRIPFVSPHSRVLRPAPWRKLGQQLDWVGPILGRKSSWNHRPPALDILKLCLPAALLVRPDGGIPLGHQIHPRLGGTRLNRYSACLQPMVADVEMTTIHLKSALGQIDGEGWWGSTFVARRGYWWEVPSMGKRNLEKLTGPGSSRNQPGPGMLE